MVSMLGWISKAARLATGCVLAMAAAGAVAESAQGGAYHVYSCRTPAGQSAPADGWSGSKTGAYSYAEDTCSQPTGALVAALGDQPLRIANTDIATWAFGAPVGTTIAGATLWRAGDTAGGAATNAAYQFWFAGSTETEIFDECLYGLGCAGRGNLSAPLSPENRVAVPAANLGTHLYISASCGGISGYKCKAGTGDANGYAAAVYLYAADLKLEQNGGPSAGNVGGELASAPVVRGTSDLTFSATDPGAGVYEALFSVDGQLVQSTVVDENGGRCRNVGQTTDGLAAFLYVKPCQGSVSADVGFDTTRTSNGPHHLIVSVLDAAGNAAPVLDREITVANPPPPCAAGAAGGPTSSPDAILSVSWKGARKERVTSPYGHAQAVTGRLTGPGRAPIAGAPIEVIANPTYSGATPLAVASARTGLDGRFSVRVSTRVSSRTLCFAYRSHPGDARAAATYTLALSVRAGIALGVAPRVSSVGRSIFFRGRLLGGPVPKGGKQLVLEARSPGSPWIEFKVIRTDARGRYRASYRFKFRGPVAYQFRVVSEPEADYPFAAGSSNVVGVRER
jgi:hypothetical protein